jgi:chromosome segregation ATPase
MTLMVHTFSCPRCKRGDFRSLPGADGKAFCPWCGDAVSAAAAPGAPDPAPAAPPPAAEPPGDGALRERLAALERRCEQAESELRRELEKKEGIKRAVSVELGRLNSELGETRLRLKKTEEDLPTAAAELARLKDELERERKASADLAGVRAALDEREKTVKTLEAELAETRKAARGHQDGLEIARHQAEQLKADLAKLKASSAAEVAQLWKSVAAGEDKLKALQRADVELRELKARAQEERAKLEKERGGLQAKAAALQAELEKRDQRIRELQLLIKTLGERLNDLSSRRP